MALITPGSVREELTSQGMQAAFLNILANHMNRQHPGYAHPYNQEERG